MRRRITLIKMCILLILTFCYTTIFASEKLSAIAWQQKAAEYQALSRTIYRSATLRLSDVLIWWKTIQDPKASSQEKQQATKLLSAWNALPFNEQKVDSLDKPLAVILDIDETILNNAPYAISRLNHAQAFTENSWKDWINARQAIAIPGAVEFTQWAESHQIAVFYVSNRDISDWKATSENLREQGFPLPNPNRLLLIDKNRGFLKDKISRRQWVNQHYRVIALFGDSLGDFTTVSQLEPYSNWWGERWYAMPNPIYGAWMDDLTADCNLPTTNSYQTAAIQTVTECLGEVLVED